MLYYRIKRTIWLRYRITKKIQAQFSWKVWNQNNKTSSPPLVLNLNQTLLVNKSRVDERQKQIYKIAQTKEEALVYNLIHEAMTCLKQGIKALLLLYFFCKIRTQMLYCRFIILVGWVALLVFPFYCWNNGVSWGPRWLYL